MEIIVAHNYYRSAFPSGEDLVVNNEQKWFQQASAVPILLRKDSDFVAKSNIWEKFKCAISLGGDSHRRRRLRVDLSELHGLLLHAHNLWPLFTPDLILAAKDLVLPTILTLHNDRLIATNQRLVYNGCLRRPRNDEERLHLSRLSVFHPSLLNEWAYRRALRIWWQRRVPQTAVDAYIVFTAHQRDRCIRAGLPAERIVIKPNAVPDPGHVGEGPGDYAVLVGRLSAEKGVDDLATAWTPDLPPLRVVGDGPLRPRLEGIPNITCLGRLTPAEVAGVVAGARFLLMTSRGYEGFPLVLPEALACGTPCLIPALGGLPEIVRDGICGRVFAPGDHEDLRAKVRQLWDEAPAMRAACRAEYEAKYTPERNVRTLLTIYDNVLNKRRPDTGLATP